MSNIKSENKPTDIVIIHREGNNLYLKGRVENTRAQRIVGAIIYRLPSIVHDTILAATGLILIKCTPHNEPSKPAKYVWYSTKNRVNPLKKS